MAKKEDQSNGTLNFGEIGTIRNILMGEQMSQYEEKFRALEAEVSALKAELNQQIQQSSENASSGLDELKATFGQQISDLTNHVEQKNETLEASILASNQEQRQLLAKLFTEMGQKILEG